MGHHGKMAAIVRTEGGNAILGAVGIERVGDRGVPGIIDKAQRCEAIGDYAFRNLGVFKHHSTCEKSKKKLEDTFFIIMV